MTVRRYLFHSTVLPGFCDIYYQINNGFYCQEIIGYGDICSSDSSTLCAVRFVRFLEIHVANFTCLAAQQL